MIFLFFVHYQNWLLLQTLLQNKTIVFLAYLFVTLNNSGMDLRLLNYEKKLHNQLVR